MYADSSPSSQRWFQIKEILGTALDLPVGERLGFVRAACGEDGELRQEVEAYLQADTEVGDFIATPIFSLRGDAGSDGASDPNEGLTLGSYRLVRRLARGGMGAVYLAERADEQYEQQVALKLIKRGMDTDEIVARFRAERQILAHLAHPNIARLLDGGMTADDLPYFVMEYVEGEPITDYCDRLALPTTERLRLFRTVCEAVHFAHQNLVVHRDLKPGNILVTPDGTPKLLDFGIAKLLADAEEGAGAVPGGLALVAPTVHGSLPFTPAYASPEQVRGEPITTASDVYSLGVLLYELLTGHRPYRASEQEPAGLAREIMSADPPRPSTVVRRPEEVTSAAGESRVISPAQVAEVRDGDPQRLSRRLKGDLDNIVLTALAKEKERRYGSAGELAEDLRRHLEGMPVRARPDTAAYRLRKFVGRHKLSVAAATLILVLLVAFAVTSWAQAVENARQRDAALAAEGVAKKAQQRAEKIKTVLKNILLAVDPDEARGQNITIAKFLDLGQEVVAKELADDPIAKAELLDLLGQIAYHWFLNERADALLGESRTIRQEVFGPASTEVLASLSHHVNLLRTTEADSEKIEALLREIVRVQRSIEPLDHGALAAQLHNLGSFLEEQGKLEEARVLLEEGLEIKRTYLPANEETQESILKTQNTLALVYWKVGNLEEAEALLRQVLAERRDLFGDKPHSDIARSLNNYAIFLMELGRYAEAEPLYDADLKMRREIFAGLDGVHPAVASSLNNTAFALEAQGELARAEAYFREALGIYEQLDGDPDRSIKVVERNLASTLAKQGRYEECRVLAEGAWSFFANRAGEPDLEIAKSQNVLGACLAGLGRFAEAEELLLASHPAIEEYNRQPYLQDARQRLVDLYAAWGKPEKAAPYRD